MPEVIQRDCAECGEPLEPLMASLGMLTHPRCSVTGLTQEQGNPAIVAPPVAQLFDTDGAVPLPGLAADLHAEFTTMIRWHEEFSPRSQQVSLGPSDLGIECDRRLAYKVAGIQGPHKGDPWPAFVGSAIHSRVEQVVKKYGEQHGGVWMIEQRVVVDPLISGRADLARSPLVVDIKTAGPDMMKKVAKQGPPDSYKVQINAYAKGFNDAGYPITQVAFVFLPRSGWLKDMYVWADSYRPELATNALARVYGIADTLNKMDIMNNPHRWEQIPANPSYLCEWCPLYNKYLEPDLGADDKGCPGYRSKGRK